jgi:hypothetical protein
MLYVLTDMYQRLGRKICFHVQGRILERMEQRSERGRSFLPSVGSCTTRLHIAKESSLVFTVTATENANVTDVPTFRQRHTYFVTDEPIICRL